jgi:armadillo repeat-containing protein 8
MVRVQSPPILAQLRAARSHSEEIATLRLLKDEIVGHVQRKEKWIEQGILDFLVKALTSTRSPVRLNGKESRGHHAQPRTLSEDELVRLQALQLLASIASGESFTRPRLATERATNDTHR